MDLPLLSLSIDGRLSYRNLDEGRAPSEDMAEYKRVRPGDLVINKLSARDGAMAVSSLEGIVSPAYWVFELLRERVHPRFMHYLLHSSPYRAEISRVSKVMPPAQFDLPRDQLRRLPVVLPALREQSTIAHFLDRETARIDRVVAARARLLDLLATRDLALTWIAITGTNLPGERRSSGHDWLGSVPVSWPVAAVSTQFEVQLGRMLNPERAAGPNPAPYVRNANVRWDSVDVTDLAQMDFPIRDQQRYRLKPGDVLINEGGAGMGRTAIWREEVDECYFQKSVLRLRPRGDSQPRWIVECMRVAVAQKLFLVEGNIATIPHLPAETLRVHRFPFPPRIVQDRQLEWLEQGRGELGRARDAIHRQLELLFERRQALVTAAVSGQITVPKEAA